MPGQMNKKHQHQSKKNEGYYTRQFERTKHNKARRLWRALRDNPRCTVTYKALREVSPLILRKLGVSDEMIETTRRNGMAG